MKRSALAALAFAALAFADSVVLHAQTAYLVKDINSTRSSGTSSQPAEYTGYNGRVYFAAYTSLPGYEVWSTDGTTAGTIQVSDITGAYNVVRPRRFAVVNGHLVFNAADSHGEELWVTDGTRAGTRLMADINSGAPSSYPGDRVVDHDRMFFAAYDGIDGNELWITDGTPQGTHFVKDLVAGPNGSDPHSFVSFHGAVYFLANGKLWKSDGTEAGTVVVANVSALQLSVAGDRLFFAGYTEESGTEPWVSDGTAAGTHMITELGPAKTSLLTSSVLQPFGDGVLFTVDNKLWISDGTAAGTHVVSDSTPAANYVSTNMAVLNGIAFFSATTSQTGYELWRTDGTSAGTYLVRDIEPGPESSGAQGFLTVGDKVFFAASQNGTAGVWTTDGTASGTQRVPSGPLYLLNSALTNIDGVVYFSAANALNGIEPWRTDGTEAGTRMIANVANDPAPMSDPVNLVGAGDQLYFFAWDGLTEPTSSGIPRTLYRTDGTAEGTIRLSEEPGAASLRPVGRSIFFEWNGHEMWKSDGTPETTGPATEFIHRFPDTPTLPFPVGDKLFAWASVGFARDNELFATKLAPGSPAIDLGVEGGSGFTEYAGKTMFFNDDQALSITDGTAAGTLEVARLETPAYSTQPAVVRGQFFFTNRGSDTGDRLWKSDGTYEGTMLVKALPQNIAELTPAGGNLFFKTGTQLAVSDGTEAGTRILPATPQTELTVVGDRVLFLAEDAEHGREPWVSDGTEAGTRLLVDMNPGMYGSDAAYFAPAGAAVYFRAYSEAAGYELWVTDGTAEGTKLAADVEPGRGDSSPRELTPAGNRVFFSAQTAATGRELWAMPLSATPSLTIDDVRASESGANAHFTVRLSAASAQNVSVDYATADDVAIAGSDYDAKSGTLVFAPGETAKTIDVSIRPDAETENNEAFRMLLRNAGGATVARSEGAAIIEDDDQFADLAVTLDYAFLYAGGDKVNVTNHGPRVATNAELRATVTPLPRNDFCSVCRETFQVLPGETFATGMPTHSLELQQYYTATAHALQRDPQPSNNTIAWTAKGAVVMEALSLVPGADAKVSFYDYGHAATANVESSNPAVLTVPSSTPGQLGDTVASFMVHAVSVGRATIRVFNAQGTIGTLDVDVLAPGTKVRWPGAITAFGDNTWTNFDRYRVVDVDAAGTAPYTGATATGLVTIVTSDERELGRVTLLPGVLHYHIPIYPTQLGEQAIEFRYSGDDNFLPMTVQSRVLSERGNVTVAATAETNTVHVRVTGSPGATPTGTITIGVQQTTLTPVRPGLAEAIVTLANLPPGTQTLSVVYSGDAFYFPTTQDVRVTSDRRRGARH